MRRIEHKSLETIRGVHERHTIFCDPILHGGWIKPYYRIINEGEIIRGRKKVVHHRRIMRKKSCSDRTQSTRYSLLLRTEQPLDRAWTSYRRYSDKNNPIDVF